MYNQQHQRSLPVSSCSRISTADVDTAAYVLKAPCQNYGRPIMVTYRVSYSVGLHRFRASSMLVVSLVILRHSHPAFTYLAHLSRQLRSYIAVAANLLLGAWSRLVATQYLVSGSAPVNVQQPWDEG